MYEFMNYQVRNVMSRPVSIEPEASLGEAERVLEKNGFNALPVVDADDQLIGVVSTLELLKALHSTTNRSFRRTTTSCDGRS